MARDVIPELRNELQGLIVRCQTLTPVNVSYLNIHLKLCLKLWLKHFFPLLRADLNSFFYVWINYFSSFRN